MRPARLWAMGISKTCASVNINAMREVEEEVGLTVPLEKFNKIDTIKFDGERSKVFGNVYLLDGLELDPDNMKL